MTKVVGNRAKGRISKRVLQENKSSQLFGKTKHFLPSDIHTCVCVSWGKTSSFFRTFYVLCFLLIPVLRFALLPYCRRSITEEYLVLCQISIKALLAKIVNDFNRELFPYKLQLDMFVRVLNIPLNRFHLLIKAKQNPKEFHLKYYPVVYVYIIILPLELF